MCLSNTLGPKHSVCLGMVCVCAPLDERAISAAWKMEGRDCLLEWAAWTWERVCTNS